MDKPESELDKWLREDVQSGRRAARHAASLAVLERHGLGNVQEAVALRVFAQKRAAK